MRFSARRAGAAGIAAWIVAAVIASCSKTPTFVDDTKVDEDEGIPCTSAVDCPGLESECASRTCIQGRCGVDIRPTGYLTGAQNDGDCAKTACDGAGVVASLPDRGDVPGDGNECTDDLCQGGAPAHQNAAEGTPCGVSLSCNEAGQCAGCTLGADCGEDSACVAYSCVEAICVLGYVPAGEGDPGAQIVGDCHRVTCNGSGATSTVVDDTDLPNDGNPCTLDVCTSGAPSHAPAPGGAPCGASFTCDGQGTCSGCATDADCGTSTACGTFACNQGACVTTYVPSGQGDPGGQTAHDCQKKVCDGAGGTKSIPDDADVGSDGNECTKDACSQGALSFPPEGQGKGCSGGQCDGGGTCVECFDDGDCGQPTACMTPVCNGGSCNTSYVPYGQGDPGGQSSGNCHTVTCDGGGGSVDLVDDGDVPSDGNACTQDYCSGGNAYHDAIAPQDDGNPCTTDTCDPASGQTIYTDLANGAVCGSCQSCWSGDCFDDCGPCDYCNGGFCDTTCGFCEYCNGSFCDFDPWCAP